MIGTLLELASWLLAVPLAVVGVECLAALRPRRRRDTATELRPRIAVIMPAHDEAAGIGNVLPPILRELGTGDTLLVVADNCSDDTAAIARAAGASVLERRDDVRRGKGYALDFAVRHLSADPPEVVIIVDADCQVAPGTLSSLARVAALTGRPAQALYTFAPPATADLRDRLSAFALVVRNQVRPIGADALGVGCPLQGSGMAFPWRVIRGAKLASGNLVEDLQLGIDLAIAGTPARLVAHAHVGSALPAGAEAKASQRTRWEHGHLTTIGSQVPRLLRAAVRQRRLELLGLALDLAVPPLALLAAATAAFLGVASVYGVLTGDFRALQPALSCSLLAALGIIAAQMRYGRDVIDLKTLLAAPLYVVAKLPIYAGFLLRRQKRWVRTSRD